MGPDLKDLRTIDLTDPQPYPKQFSFTDAAAVQLRAKGTNIPLPSGSLCPTPGGSAVDMAAPIVAILLVLDCGPIAALLDGLLCSLTSCLGDLVWKGRAAIFQIHKNSTNVLQEDFLQHYIDAPVRMPSVELN